MTDNNMTTSDGRGEVNPQRRRTPKAGANLAGQLMEESITWNTVTGQPPEEGLTLNTLKKQGRFKEDVNIMDMHYEYWELNGNEYVIKRKLTRLERRIRGW